MRFDAIGLWWEDLPTTRASGRQERPMPNIPATSWRPPTEFPNLDAAVVLSLDTETYDPELLTNGPGWARGKGHIVGISIGALDRFGNIGKWYFPIRHETCREDNLDPEAVMKWLRHTLASPSTPKVGANLQYDIGWLAWEGVTVAGELIDVQFAEALLDESAKVSLEILGQKYLGEGKESNALYEWLSEWFCGEPNGSQRKHIYRAPPCMVGPYAESDAVLPLKLAGILYPLLEKEGLLPVFNMECKLIRLMMEMRLAGVTVDVARAEQLRETLQARAAEETQKLEEACGMSVNVNASASIADAFNALGLKFPVTAKGNSSFTKKFLDDMDHPIANRIKEIRKLEKLSGTFVESYVLNSNINGRVYGSFHQLRGEGGGTRSGRFSSSNPNLQNIPSRDDELAPLVRGLFIPDPGHKQWRRYDYSQVEYRMLIHYAIGQAGENARRHFIANPETDYHIYAQNVVKDATGIFIERKPIKNINFGLIYGMGVPTLAANMGMTKAAAKSLMEAYFKGVPFAKPTMDAAMAEAKRLGVVTTILGRLSRFDLWEPANYQDIRPAIPYEAAVNQYGPNIQRAHTHKALNRKLQGSSADLMKMAMLKCYEDGVFAETGVPRLTVHDELDFSDPGGKDEAFREVKHIMETAIKLSIPFRTDCEAGPSWGNLTSA